jgi:hypothetical protein
MIISKYKVVTMSEPKKLILKDGAIVTGYDNEAEFMYDLITSHLVHRLKLLLKVPIRRIDRKQLYRVYDDLKRNRICLDTCIKDTNIQ